MIALVVSGRADRRRTSTAIGSLFGSYHTELAVDEQHASRTRPRPTATSRPRCSRRSTPSRAARPRPGARRRYRGLIFWIVFAVVMVLSASPPRSMGPVADPQADRRLRPDQGRPARRRGHREHRRHGRDGDDAVGRARGARVQVRPAGHAGRRRRAVRGRGQGPVPADLHPDDRARRPDRRPDRPDEPAEGLGRLQPHRRRCCGRRAARRRRRRRRAGRLA